MRLRAWIWIAAAILLTVIAVGGKVIFRELPLPSEPNPPSLPAFPVQPHETKFKPTTRGCGPFGYVQGYKLSDGRTLSDSNKCFNTTAEAKRKLGELLSESAVLVERNRKYRTKRFDNLKVERVLVTFPQSGKGKGGATIFYLHENCLALIEAPSLELALEFEKTEAWAF